MAEDERDKEEGFVSAFIADDAVDSVLHKKLKALRAERERCERSMRFGLQMRAFLERNEANCPVCLAGGSETEAFAVLPDCFHILCRACLEKQSGNTPSFACPMCRVSVHRLEVVVFRSPDAGGEQGCRGPDAGNRDSDNTNAGDSHAIVEGDQPLGCMEEFMPSKMQRLLGLLQEVLTDPEERVLVYTQWAAHVDHLQTVLEASGVQTLALAGELRETMDVLARFGRPEEPRVLLLSSQRHSSGINLQMARHVVIVHPYCTPTAVSHDDISRRQMLAFEAQAIGRVRRYPQRKPVHVHRIYAVSTVEEDLYLGADMRV
eukprot:TRINITY_DN30515_c0_g1_i2.p1 TRINITY_DN30515_c0_g1~~TRINITY_DN30515_c0_g1_i2.p1  ORF type:complete len:319 (-),score=65.50 TRINITY_DN30515_c0_g1_i2:36-992(-)